ncbi:hypothetical protein GCM10009590_29480 [Brachybacterium alimentarium]
MVHPGLVTRPGPPRTRPHGHGLVTPPEPWYEEPAAEEPVAIAGDGLFSDGEVDPRRELRDHFAWASSYALRIVPEMRPRSGTS